MQCNAKGEEGRQRRSTHNNARSRPRYILACLTHYHTHCVTPDQNLQQNCCSCASSKMGEKGVPLALAWPDTSHPIPQSSYLPTLLLLVRPALVRLPSPMDSSACMHVKARRAVPARVSLCLGNVHLTCVNKECQHKSSYFQVC